MKLYFAKIPTISQDIIHSLAQNHDIEVENEAEAHLDIEAVLKEYLRMDRELSEKAKDLMERRSLPYSNFSRVKRSIALERKFIVDEDEIVPYLTNQLLESFMHSQHIAEVFTSDEILRKKVQGLLRKHMEVENELDQEVRGRMKHLEEGTAGWDIEYSRVMEQVKRKHKLIN